ncbi:hypothetical protein [Photorhabdus heterorhabditis]|uniref:hypothetical protein n=1 Tax=Photorhabdus heterorhabditis TaxID=880156 RepID=UPI001561BB2D|nr:hypothetical protein [Photorhabdus heterorhabditis]NRN29688.1 hypothetical protein [Photorhabdus heterorhabditis subsp. aluminescens]
MLFTHTSFNIEKLLSTADDNLFEYIFERPADVVRADLTEKLRAGIKITTNVKCDNFCTIRGCQGHKMEGW